MEAAVILALKKVFGMFVTKKRIIGWVSAVALAIGAAAAGMNTPEFREAVCSAPVLEQVKAE